VGILIASVVLVHGDQRLTTSPASRNWWWRPTRGANSAGRGPSVRHAWRRDRTLPL